MPKPTKRVADGLVKENFKVWYDAELLPGQEWAAAVSKALRESKAMVVLLTPAALRSTRVQREIQYALGDETYSHRLIPVIVGSPEKLPKKDIPWILQSMQILHLSERGNLDKEIRKIAEMLLKPV